MHAEEHDRSLCIWWNGFGIICPISAIGPAIVSSVSCTHIHFFAGEQEMIRPFEKRKNRGLCLSTNNAISHFKRCISNVALAVARKAHSLIVYSITATSTAPSWLTLNLWAHATMERIGQLVRTLCFQERPCSSPHMLTKRPLARHFRRAKDGRD